MKTPETGNSIPKKEQSLNIENLIDTPEYNEFIDKVRSGSIEPTFTEYEDTEADTPITWEPKEPNLTEVFRDNKSEASKKYGYVFYWYSDDGGNLYVSHGLGMHEQGGSTGYFRFE